MRELDGTIIIAVAALMAVVILLLIRREIKESKRLAALARRKGLKFSRKDRFRLRRELNRRFTVKGSGISYGWVRDVGCYSDIRVFRVNEVHKEKGTITSKPKTRVKECIGAVFPAPGGGRLKVETDGRGVTTSHNLDKNAENATDLRVQAIAAYLKKAPAPHALGAVFDGDGCFAYITPPFDAKDTERVYGYMVDFADRLYETKMKELAS